MSLESFIASNRFGLGARPGDLDKIARDPQGWLRAQIMNPVIPPDIAAIAQENTPFYKNIGPGGDKVINGTANIDKNLQRQAIKKMITTYADHTTRRFNAQVKSDQPFVERLVMFWSNHFTVSTQKKLVAGLVNRYEAEAIRPHVTGKFADMLLASAKHPAMGFYLDNVRSIGPDSPAGRRRDKGLNENLAREILELHTLGVGGGYTQADVIALAKIITGWGLDREQGTFAFNDRLHEPGSKTLLGVKFDEGGVSEGERALRMLAAHPATARHVATKLARHFIADDPPADAIARLSDIFLRSGGDLKALALALVDIKACWADPLAKMKSPYEFVLSAYRLTDSAARDAVLLKGLESLNYRVFSATSPAGYADTATALVSPDGLLKRIEWAHVFARTMPVTTDPQILAEQSFAPVMREDTRFVIAGAESARHGIAFVLASPEFQRR